MLMDIFTAFDPDTNLLSPSIKFWLTTLLATFIISTSFWPSPSRFSSMMSLPYSYMTSQVSRTASANLPGMQTLIVPLFIFLITMNLCGLIPYVFSLTSHLVFSLSFGFPLWLSLILSASTFSQKQFLAHLLPSGAPTPLNPFLIIIETLSTAVRPITLSFRLTANMSAGHIVLTLLGIYLSTALINMSWSTPLLLTIHLGYMLFEVGISLIQAYIFCLLLTLYADDHPTK